MACETIVVGHVARKILVPCRLIFEGNDGNISQLQVIALVAHVLSRREDDNPCEHKLLSQTNDLKNDQLTAKRGNFVERS